MIDQYNIIIEQEHSTVVSHYEVKPRETSATETEEALESALCAQLVEQGYSNPEIHDEKALIAHLRQRLGELNDCTFSDAEWSRLFNEIAGEHLTIEDKTEMIQQQEIRELLLDNGEKRNIRLINKSDVSKNRLDVIRQYVPEGGKHANRYDVTILVNGLPLVHIELKRRGGSIKEAFNQINRYQRESFWAGHALFDYVQIFVISSGTRTKYYSNTTRFAHEKEVEGQQQSKAKRDSNSFEFTSFWADEENNILPDLRDFAATFLAKHTLLNILTKYCVYTVDKMLMVMRPYQIAATEKILLQIKTAIYNRKQGTKAAGGFIWHTTGSGKTLTSYKTAQLATRMEGVSKVLFVVDRQDLDYQTMKEYNNFEPDCVNGNTNSAILLKQLNNPRCRIIITTIQKLSSLLNKRRNEIKCLDDNIVFIFDECHRSQFGKMHSEIVRRFKKYMLFGFTGTPIFAANAGGSMASLRTTADIFGGKPDAQGKPTQPLHTYTIIDAIKDHNVLKFKVDYIRTIKMKDNVTDEDVWGIETDEALHSPTRVAKNVEYVLKNYGIKTKQRERYALSRLMNVDAVVRRGSKATEERTRVAVSGFNSMFATDSVDSAIAYYNEFKRQMAEPGAPKLKIATIFTFAANEEENEFGLLDSDMEDPDQLDVTSKEALNRAIADYNAMFGTSYDTSSEKFQNYYKDVSLRLKNHELDMVIVVGMFLTGFDAKTLNTLWVDKNLKMHGLLQAFSRTNRILNAVKDCGNIVCFRNLEERVKESLALFGDKDAGSIVLIRPFADYYYGYKENGKDYPGYKELADKLLAEFDIQSLRGIYSEEKKKEFIRLFGNILKAMNLLSVFDEFTEDKRIITDAQRQDYTDWYLALRDEFKSEEHREKTSILDDIEFETELVKNVQVSIDYILTLVAQYHEENCRDKELRLRISREIKASPDLRDKLELIERFIESITPESDIFGSWSEYLAKAKENELNEIITSENLNADETHKFMDNAFAMGFVQTAGIAITKLLPPMPIIGANKAREAKKAAVISKLEAYFEKYYNI